MAEDRLFPLTPVDIRLMKDVGTDAADPKKTLHEKSDLSQSTSNEILTQTSDMQPRVQALQSDVANLDGDVAAVKSVVDANGAALADPTSGLASIKSSAVQAVNAVADVDADLALVAADAAAAKANLGQTSTGTVASHVENVEVLIGTPVAGSVSADISQLDSKISQMQNNTRTVVALNTELELPPTGQTSYVKIMLTNYDNNGDMLAPDAPPSVSVETGLGVNRSTNLGNWDGSTFTQGVNMIEISAGRYYIFYRLPSTATPNEQLVFTFTLVEGASTRYSVRTAYVVEEISSTFTGTDRTVLNSVDTKATDIQNKIGVPANASISNDIAAVKSQTASIESKSDIIDANVDVVKDTLLPEIRTKAAGTFDRETMSLQALAEAVSSLGTSAGDKIWDATKTSGSIAALGGVETVVLSETEGMQEGTGIVNALDVIPVTSCTNYTVELTEDAAGNKLLAKVSNWNSVKDGLLMLTLNRAFVNADSQKRLYVKVTNDSNTSAAFNVKVRILRV